MKARGPHSVAILISVTVICGAAVLGWQLTDVTAWAGRDLVSFLIVALVVVVSEQFWIPLRHGAETENFSLTDAVFAASLVLVRPSVLLLAVAAGVVAGEAVRRTAPHKLAFNVGQFLVGLAAATAVYGLFEDPPTFEGRAWLAAVLAMATFFVVNTVAVALVIALVQQKRLVDVLLPPLGLSALHFAGNLALGLLGALVWTIDPLALCLVAVPLALAYGAYRGWLRSWREQDQMDEMAGVADAISAGGDLMRRVPEGSGTERVARLASTLNGMLRRLEESFLREQRFIREASHELRTPITISRGHLEVLDPDPSPGEVGRAVDLVLDELERMGRIVEDMTTLAQAEHPDFAQPVAIELEPFVAEIAAKAYPLLDGRLRTGPVPSATVHADPQRLTQALLNLLQNAAVHTRAGSPVRLRTLEEPNAWRFEVVDEGGGLRANQEELAFQPFHRLDLAQPGSGLGLAIVRGIAEAHGGTAGVENRPGEGATFWLRVPR